MSLPVLALPGVAAGSPLGKAARSVLEDLAELRFGEVQTPAPRRWLRTVRGTALQWQAPDEPNPAGPGDTTDHVLMLGCVEAGRGRTSLCVVDSAGYPLLHPFHGLGACWREPWIASLSLIESSDGGGTWEHVAEAHVSAARSYRSLLDALARAALALVRRRLLRADLPRGPWHPVAAQPAGRARYARARLASVMAWLGERLGGDIWGIAVLEESRESLLAGDRVLRSGGWLTIPSSEGFIADPFFWPGRPGVLLCERYQHRTGRGVLATLSPDKPEPAGAIEALPFPLESHLSYPFVCELDGRIYCLPEMAEAGRQVLYELPPGGPPRPIQVIAENVAMADPTLMQAGGLFWIAYSDAALDPYDNLCLMYADDLRGPWRPHRGNPVKIDVRSSRPGGTPFRIGRELFRPAQDCSRTYGGAIAINRVVRCDRDGYDEVVTTVLRPEPGGPFPDGLHHLAVLDECAAIDGKRISFHPVIALSKARRLMMRRRLREIRPSK